MHETVESSLAKIRIERRFLSFTYVKNRSFQASENGVIKMNIAWPPRARVL